MGLAARRASACGSRHATVTTLPSPQTPLPLQEEAAAAAEGGDGDVEMRGGLGLGLGADPAAGEGGEGQPSAAADFQRILQVKLLLLLLLLLLLCGIGVLNTLCLLACQRPAQRRTPAVPAAPFPAPPACCDSPIGSSHTRLPTQPTHPPIPLLAALWNGGGAACRRGGGGRGGRRRCAPRGGPRAGRRRVNTERRRSCTLPAQLQHRTQGAGSHAHCIVPLLHHPAGGGEEGEEDKKGGAKGGDDGDSEGEEDDEAGASRKKKKLASRLKIAELKQVGGGVGEWKRGGTAGRPVGLGGAPVRCTRAGATSTRALPQ